MEKVKEIEEIEERKGRAATVGTFDGVHLGHRRVIESLRGISSREGLLPAVITFDRHPLEVVGKGKAPRMLQSRHDRDVSLKEEGVEVIEVAFTPELSSLTAREWMKRLRDEYNVKALITGYDNKFGCDGRGMAPSDYVALGEELGMKVEIAPELPGICSSSIREALKRGDVEEARRMLGRGYIVKGRVVEGRHLGRELGFPTANLDVCPRIQLPKSGVYAARLNGMPAVVNVGNNPTIDSGNPITVEAHLVDFEGDLYGREMNLEFVERIRGERRFDSIDSLKAQIKKDKAQAENILKR